SPPSAVDSCVSLGDGEPSQGDLRVDIDDLVEGESSVGSIPGGDVGAEGDDRVGLKAGVEDGGDSCLSGLFDDVLDSAHVFAAFGGDLIPGLLAQKAEVVVADEDF